jgi:septal ring factor EnvC (AmiA/AmiB activator)
MSQHKERDSKGRADWAYRFDELRHLEEKLVSRSVERMAQSRVLLERTETPVRASAHELGRRAQEHREMAARLRTLIRHLPIADDRQRFADYAADAEREARHLEREAARRAKLDGDPPN